MSVQVDGALARGVTAKDLILAIINHIGVGGGAGHVIEYRGDVFRNLSIEGRMTVCNMSIEGGARAGLIAPDDTTFAYLEGRPSAPKGKAWEQALDHWRSLVTDPDAEFEKRVTLRAESIEPFVTWGVTPAQSVPVGGRVPDPCPSPIRARATSPAVRWPTWDCNRIPQSKTSHSTACSSARAPTPVSKTYAPRRPWSAARRWRTR